MVTDQCPSRDKHLEGGGVSTLPRLLGPVGATGPHRTGLASAGSVWPPRSDNDYAAASSSSDTATVTSVGDVFFSIVSRVTTHFCTSRREGSSN